MEQNKNKSLSYLIVTVLFVGILLTCSIFFLTASAIRSDSAQAPDCYDGSVIEGESFFAHFSRAVYQNRSLLSFIEKCEYHLFKNVNDPNVLVGKENFLFEVEDTENNYNYLQDYKGNAAFGEKQNAAVLAELKRREAFYAEKGAEYLLVVLPNAQSVYSEYMPDYLGNISNNTRLCVLDRYLRHNGFTSFLNLTEELKEHKAEGLLYNNTENSLNARGMYYVYLAVCSRFSDEVLQHATPRPISQLTCFEHWTKGKEIARRAGLSEVVQNRTVSLSGDTTTRYRYTFNVGLCARTVKIDYSMNQIHTPPLLLQFTDTWERSQIEPFFSNTFSSVTYQTNLEADEGIFAQALPNVVIQFIYENELSRLLPQA